MSGHNWRRAAVATGVLVLATIVTFAVTGDRPDAAPPIPVDPVTLVAVPGGVAATSATHGPRRHKDGRAAGFSYDELGAAVAASNLVPRVSLAAGPGVFEPTLAGQCWGDIATAATQLRTAVADPDSGDPTGDRIPRSLYYRVLAGDPTRDLVVVSLLADTAQAAAAGGYARIDATLRWHDDDWQLRVPLTPPAVQADRDGYTLLAGNP